MYREVTVDKKQNLIDICLQVYGTTELLFKFANDNGLQIDSDVYTGDVLNFDDSFGDYRILKRINNNSLSMINPVVSDVPAPVWILETGIWGGIGTTWTADGIWNTI